MILRLSSLTCKQTLVLPVIHEEGKLRDILMQKGLCAGGDVPVRVKQMARYRRLSLLCAYVLFLRQDLKTFTENKTAGVYLREKGRKGVISCTGSLSQAAGCFQPVSVAQLEGSCCGHALGAPAAFLSRGGTSRARDAVCRGAGFQVLVYPKQHPSQAAWPWHPVCLHLFW